LVGVERGLRGDLRIFVFWFCILHEGSANLAGVVGSAVRFRARAGASRLSLVKLS
jgi:hypothetical protein